MCISDQLLYAHCQLVGCHPWCVTTHLVSRLHQEDWGLSWHASRGNLDLHVQQKQGSSMLLGRADAEMRYSTSDLTVAQQWAQPLLRRRMVRLSCRVCLPVQVL